MSVKKPEDNLNHTRVRKVRPLWMSPAPSATPTTDDKRRWTTLAAVLLSGCSLFEGTAAVVSGTVKGTLWVLEGAYELAAGTTKAVYSIGKFTFEVVKAPLEWPMTHQDLETIDALPVKEAIRLGRVKSAPYTVKGRRYVPMTVAHAQTYRETGIASWYGEETRRQKGGHMTANGEAFHPGGLTAAHKYLPLPTNVKVTNLDNGRFVIVRVNDRGPFPSANNPHSGKRIIDVSWGAAKRLGFVDRGLARVRVETIQLREATRTTLRYDKRPTTS